MGSVKKRKSPEDPSLELETHPSQRQLLQNGDESVACVHDVSYPEGYVPPNSSSSSPPQPSEPAKKFPFPLDPFQSQAITCLENGESVMVTISSLLFLLCLCTKLGLCLEVLMDNGVEWLLTE